MRSVVVGTLTYLKNFVTDRYIASVTPTSIFGVRRVCRKINFATAAVLVEFGPGTGVFTRYLLERIRPDARLVLIERNPNFVALLKRKLRDPRVSVVNDSAENVLPILQGCGGVRADYILSGIPFSFFPAALRNRILAASHAALRPGGKFLAYQTFYQSPAHLSDPLEEQFGAVCLEYELRNIPPLRICEAVKEADARSQAACDAAGG
jgi:phospholipid N-methyltransferase